LVLTGAELDAAALDIVATAAGARRVGSPGYPDLQQPTSNRPAVHKSPMQSAVRTHGIPRLSPPRKNVHKTFDLGTPEA
jgi:hypothetical protein